MLLKGDFSGVNSLSYSDGMVLFTPTVLLFTLFRVWRTSAGPQDIGYNTTKTVCMLSRYSTKDRVGNEGLSFVDEYRYLRHVMTVDCRDAEDIEIHTNTLLENLLSAIVTHSKNLLMSSDSPVRVWHFR